MKAQVDQKAVDCRFAVGGQVLALVPQRTSSLSASFCDPYTVLKKIGDTNYVIGTPEGRRKTRLCHINLLKQYQGRLSEASVACAAMGQIVEEDVGKEVETVGFRLRNSEALKSLDNQLVHLPAEWQAAFKDLIAEFSPLVQDVPGRTSLAVHNVDIGSSAPIKQHPYRLAPSKLQSLREEVAYILGIGAIEHRTEVVPQWCLSQNQITL